MDYSVFKEISYILKNYSTTFNISNRDFLTFLILGIFFVVTLIIFATCLITSKVRHTKIRKKFDKVFNIEKHYVFQFREKQILVFDDKNLTNKKNMEFENFYSFFPDEEKKKLTEWFEYILGAQSGTLNDNDLSIVANMLIKKDKKKSIYAPILLTVTKINRESKRIYANRYFLNNFKNINFPLLSRVSLDLDKITNMYDLLKFNKGAVFLISFRQNKNVIKYHNSKEIKYLILNEIYYVARKYLPYIYIDPNKSEILLFTTLKTNSINNSKLAQKILDAAEHYFEIEGIQRTYNYCLTYSNMSEFNTTFENCYKSLWNFNRLTYEGNKKFAQYTSKSKDPISFEESYVAEINKVIRNNLIDISFRPVVHIAKKSITNFGYMTQVSVKDSIFKNIDELYKYAKEHNMEKEVFSLISRKTMGIFNSEKTSDSHKVYIEISLDQAQYISRIYAHLRQTEETKRIVFRIKNNEFIDIKEDSQEIKTLKNLKTLGYAFALTIEDGDYNLINSFYELFDMFFVYTNLKSNVKQDSKAFLSLHNLLSKLVSYKKNIVCFDCRGWNAIELLVKSGVTYLSDDVIAPRSPMLLPLDKKINKKLLTMSK